MVFFLNIDKIIVVDIGGSGELSGVNKVISYVMNLMLSL